MKITRIIFSISILLASLANAATITMPAGTIGSYSFQSGTAGNPNVYVPNPAGTTINNTSTAGGAHAIILDNLHDITIDGGAGKLLTVNGNGIAGDNTSNIRLTRFHVQNCTRGGTDPQAIKMSSPTGLVIDGLEFYNCSWVSWIFGNLANDTIINCKVTNCSEQFQLVPADGSHDIDFENNLSDHTYGGYQLECIPGSFDSKGNKLTSKIKNVTVQHNQVQFPTMTTADLQSNTGAWSSPLEQAQNVVIRWNECLGTTSDGRKPVKNGFLGLLMAIEISGSGCLCYENDVEYVNDPCSVNPAATNGLVYNNQAIGCIELYDMQGGRPPGSNTFTGNGPSVQFTQPPGLYAGTPAPPIVATPPPATIQMPPPIAPRAITSTVVNFSDGTQQTVNP